MATIVKNQSCGAPTNLVPVPESLHTKHSRIQATGKAHLYTPARSCKKVAQGKARQKNYYLPALYPRTPCSAHVPDALTIKCNRLRPVICLSAGAPAKNSIKGVLTKPCGMLF